ncbi:MAG TPA: DMT family transporter [Thermoplasmata archaeon]|nr:DMT family transporter [Thermoplasmata archaeon]
MPAAHRRAVLLSLLAAFLWALYYLFVLEAKPGASPSATMVYPFVFGGVAYAVYAEVRHQGPAFRRLWTRSSAWLRTGVLVAMQLSVLATTYLAGPVDSSLLSLIGDVVLTPVIVALLWASHRGNIGTGWFTVGCALSLVGGGLTIVGGQSLGRVEGWAWLVVPAVPLTVALYFLLSAQENERTSELAVVGQSMAAAALLTVVLSPLIPGGFGTLATVTPEALVLLALCGVTSFFLAPLLYFRAIAEAGIVIPPMMMTGIPVFTLLLSAFVLGLGLPLVAVLGIPIAVAGALLTLQGESSPGAPPPRAPSGPGAG